MNWCTIKFITFFLWLNCSKIPKAYRIKLHRTNILLSRYSIESHRIKSLIFLCSHSSTIPSLNTLLKEAFSFLHFSIPLLCRHTHTVTCFGNFRYVLWFGTLFTQLLNLKMPQFDSEKLFVSPTFHNLPMWCCSEKPFGTFTDKLFILSLLAHDHFPTGIFFRVIIFYMEVT